jgi:putative DNA primase/helicase
MVALVTAPDGKAVSLHRTYLTRDGHKADVPSPKKLMPPTIPSATRGGAIRLYTATTVLAVTEGIETALAVHLTTGLPVWAALCATGMAALVVPETVREVIICADHDAAGLQAAKALARRLLTEQKTVKILAPATVGTDWADTLERCHG